MAGLTQIVLYACEATEPSGGPALASPAEEFKTPDICMAESSAAQKRAADEIVSSDDSRKDRSRSRKVSRPVSHVPPGVSDAALLARSRSTSASRSTSSSRSSSRKR